MESKSVWDIKKIFIGCIFVGIIAWVIYQNRETINSFNTTKAVAGINTSEQKQEEIKHREIPKVDLQERINTITEQVSNLNVAEVTASSPQIQKVLKDMESLKDLPRSSAKEACINICNSL